MVNHIFFWKVALVVFLNQQHNPYAVPSLSLCSSPVKHQNCILQCSDSAVSFLINFDHPSGVLQGSCPIAGDNSSCASANYTIYQSLPHTFLSISSLDRNRDEGEWQCTHGVSNSNLQKLSVPSPLGIQKTPLVTMSDVEIEVVCEMSCQYPTANVSVEVIYAEEDKSNYQSFPSAPTIVTDFTDKTNCDSYEINYKARFTFTKSNISNLNGKKLKFKCNFTHAIIQSSTGDTGPVSEIIEVKDEETTTTSITTEGSSTTTTNSTYKSTQHNSSFSSSASANLISVTTTVQSTNNNNLSKTSYTTYIIIGSVGGSALLVLLCVVAVVLRRKFTSKFDSSQKTEQYHM